ncbi:hypothetical protein AB0B95_06515 [Streptomyces hygroscopicus]|uniref:hypothetical protein n=1 Tax=Streptomyces hygroscopicus TaxID=1912 RepID=UPI00131D4084|nr:hypothetical protein [Streptomyces hygroscopicus]
MTTSRLMSPSAPPQRVQGDPRTLTLLDLNARFLPHGQFRQLVANIQRDGRLTSTPAGVPPRAGA